MLVSVSAATAQNYKHSIGLEFGTINAASYKTFFTPNLALKADFIFYKYTVPGWSRAGWDYGYGYYGYYGWIGTVELNPNFLYQKNIKSFGWGDLDWFVGGGVSIGYALWWAAGKFGINADGGVELALKKIPLAFDFSFRPGFGMLFGGRNYYWGSKKVAPYFDWGLAWGVRYYFPIKK